MENKEKSRFTLFLERNEIWFKTVLSLAVTVAALLISVASCSNAEYQAQLSAASIERLNQEKQPFFAINQRYDENKQQYIYSIINTGGQVRYSNISIVPYIHIFQQDNQKKVLTDNDVVNEEKSPYTNQAFISLTGFYNYEPTSDLVTDLVAFSDLWLSDFDVYLGYGQTETLANDYFSMLASAHNMSKNNLTIDAEIIYFVEIDYNNYENKSLKDSFWLGRFKDFSGKTQGNNILAFQPTLEIYYQEADQNNYIYHASSMNRSVRSVINECSQYMQEVRGEFNPNISHGR